MRKIYLLIIFLLFSISVEAKELYVDGSIGNDSTTYANNDSNNSWRTVGRAAWGSTSVSAQNSSEAAQAGDTVYIAAGTYGNNGQHTDDRVTPLYAPVNRGSVGNYITFQAVGTVVLTSSPSNPGVCGDGEPIIGSKMGADAYVKWDGFTIRQATTSYRCGNGLVGVFANHTTISNCDIEGEYFDYPPAGGNNHNAIHVLGISGSLNNIIIENNKLHGFTGDSNRNDAAIVLYYVSDVIIRNNEIYDNITGMHSKTTSGDMTSILVHNNLFYNNSGDCIATQSLMNFHIYNNVFQDSQHGFYFFPQTYQSGTIKPTLNYVVNNTFDNMSTAAIRVNGYLCSWISNSYVRNNIVTNSVYAIRCDCCPTASDIQPDDIDFDYNTYDFTSNFAWSDSGNTWSFASWQGATFSQDANSETGVDPMYVDESGNDFRLQSGSPCREGQANDGVDILDLDNDGSTTDAITLGAYITGNEIIGIVGCMPPENFRIVSE